MRHGEQVLKFRAYGHKAPRWIASVLFGDRQKYGLVPDENDSCWKEWSGSYHDFYESTQKSGIGEAINNAGYKVLRKVDLEGCRVLEVGPGGLHHIPFWCGNPEFYALVDLDKKFLENASAKLTAADIPHDLRLTTRDCGGVLPAGDNEFDIIVTFYSLEHLYPFSEHLKDMLRVLKPGGKIVGAIPAEGGLAWGFGRFLTRRRWLRKNTSINPDKIICWEHPNMADEILNCLSEQLLLNKLSFWPMGLPVVDLNLILRFIFSKPL